MSFRSEVTSVSRSARSKLLCLLRLDAVGHLTTQEGLTAGIAFYALEGRSPIPNRTGQTWNARLLGFFSRASCQCGRDGRLHGAAGVTATVASSNRTQESDAPPGVPVGKAVH